MFLLSNEIQRYAWGSRTAMAEFLGRPGTTDEPEAEMWIGAYPGLSSRLADGRTLLSAIDADPVSLLGSVAVSRFGSALPFLMKVLTIGSPLSLQAHPGATHARSGFAAENERGVSLDDPRRSYRDPGHKPEMICALTPLEAFCGFRVASETLALLDELALAELDGLRSALGDGGVEAGTGWVLDLADESVEIAVASLGKAASGVSDGPYSAVLQWISRLAEEHPYDRGVILCLLCDYVRLELGDALYVPTGCLHAYLGGVGVEVMAASDNVLRGGLTPKNVDTVELQRILDFSVGPARVLTAHRDGGISTFVVPVDEFVVRRFELSGTSEPVDLAAEGPQLLLVVSGRAVFTGTDGSVLAMERGQSAFVAAGEGAVRIGGPGVLFATTTGGSAAAPRG